MEETRHSKNRWPEKNVSRVRGQILWHYDNEYRLAFANADTCRGVSGSDFVNGIGKISRHIDSHWTESVFVFVIVRRRNDGA